MAVARSPSGHSGAVQDRMPGRLLGGRYRIVSRLGEGGMGAVYLCAHEVLGRRYAVKVLRPDLATDAELAERFRNEAIAASRIGGENVVDVLDFGAEEDGALYYVMEALEGRSLGALIAEEGPLELPRALALLEQICRALGAAHARGVVHRDVKPDNVFVVRREDGTERAKVIDFGISQVTLEGAGGERLTRAGAIIGTPEYMAPEQAAGDRIDHRADVYALGVLAYEMLTGTLPIVANTPVATLVAHQTRTPDAPSRRRAGIPAEVDALVLAALAKRPEDRPASMDALAARIHGMHPFTLSVGPRSGPKSKGPAMTPGRRAGALALVAVLAAAIGLALAAGWGRRAAPPSPRASPSLPGGEGEPVAHVAPAAPVASAPEAQRTEDAPPAPPPRTTRRPATRRPLDHPDAAGGGLKPDPF